VKKYTALSLSRYLAQLSSDKPVPGGGSVSAYVACLGIGLAEMVTAIGIRKLSEESKSDVHRTLRLLQKAKKDALQVVNIDPKVYQAVMNSYKKAKKISDQGKKNRLIDEALENSFRLQADLALLVTMVKRAAESLGGVFRGSITNDLGISLKLLEAAFHGAYDTARINAVYMKDPQRKARAEQALEELQRRFKTSDASRS